MIYRGPEPEVEIPDVTVTSFVLGRAAQRGDKPALIDGMSGRVLTYAHLAKDVRAVAAGLAERGFRKGDVFGIHTPNLPEYAVAFHGVSAAGGVCTTVNPLYTANELTRQLKDAGARFLLTVSSFLDVAREAAERAGLQDMFVIGDAEGATPFEELLADPDHAPEVDVDPSSDLVLLPYSSGTTGLSKGVMVTHRNVVADICQTQVCCPLGPGDCLAGVLPFFHIYGMVAVMNQGLWAGATIVTMSRFDQAEFVDMLEHYKVTFAHLAPPTVLALARDPTIENRDLSALRKIVSGGAPLGGDLAQEVAERIGCQVIQGYGLTETTSVTHVIRSHGENRPGSIGQALPNTECRVVDPATAVDVDEGDRGELWIRGPQVMRGYLNNPTATTDTIDDEGWLHTGDVAVVEDDGFFRIVDRLKELIKYNGYQVAPAELEALIVSHPAVSDVAVVGVPDKQAGELPKAFIVSSADELDTEELIEWVAARVSPQKRVRLVERIDEIPRSASGKILRRTLVERASRNH